MAEVPSICICHQNGPGMLASIGYFYLSLSSLFPVRSNFPSWLPGAHVAVKPTQCCPTARAKAARLPCYQASWSEAYVRSITGTEIVFQQPGRALPNHRNLALPPRDFKEGPRKGPTACKHCQPTRGAISTHLPLHSACGVLSLM